MLTLNRTIVYYYRRLFVIFRKNRCCSTCIEYIFATDVAKALLLLLLVAMPGLLFSQQTDGLDKYDTTLMFEHSPKKASFYSAVLPGLGQVYNKKYWKIPIIYAGGATLVYLIGFNNKAYLKYKSAYVKKSAGDPSDMPDLAVKYDAAQLSYAMEYFRHNRDYCILGLAALYLANVIDATVDAYLFDYEVNQDLSLKVSPTMMNLPNSYNFGLSCSLRF